MLSNKRELTKKEKASSSFHDQRKGCKIVYFGYSRKSKQIINLTPPLPLLEVTTIIEEHTISDEVDEMMGIMDSHYLRRGKCKVHNVIICHCGWQVGLHDDVWSKGYNDVFDSFQGDDPIDV